MKSILFLCTGNSCRSQMAEGWCRHYHPNWRVASAGVKAIGVNPRAVQVMAEVGIDLSTHQSQTIDAFSEEQFDCVVTVCDHARESCPLFTNADRHEHAGFDDPPALAEGETEEPRVLLHYRRVRDEIGDYVKRLV